MSISARKRTYLDKDQLIQQHLPKVKRMAYHLAGRLPPCVNVDDLVQSGVIGLIEAIEHFRPELGVKLETFADKRIHGAMLDELRKAEFSPRSVRSAMRSVETAIAQLQQQLQRHPTEAEIASRLEVPLHEYQQMLRDGQGHQLLYYEDFHTEGLPAFLEQQCDPLQPAPADTLHDARFRQQLVQGITQLPEREKLIMSLYYEQELNLKEIGAVLEISESRVCQLHTQAVARLRSRLRDWLTQ